MFRTVDSNLHVTAESTCPRKQFSNTDSKKAALNKAARNLFALRFQVWDQIPVKCKLLLILGGKNIFFFFFFCYFNFVLQNLSSCWRSALKSTNCNIYLVRVPKVYTMQNQFSDCFVCVRSTRLGFHCHLIALRYKSRSPEKEFQVKTQE